VAFFALCCCRGAGPTLVAPGPVAQDYRADWEALEAARAEDPFGEAVDDAADRILSRDPTLKLRLAAMYAKTMRAVSIGDDTGAIQIATHAIARMAESSTLDDERLAFARILIRAQIRSELPERALIALDRIRKEDGRAAQLQLSAEAMIAANAIVLDRAGDARIALLAFLRWRAISADSSSGAIYAQERARALAASLTPSELIELTNQTESAESARCVAGFAGSQVGGALPDWIGECRPTSRRVGLLLPRSGKLVVFADRHLAAATSAVTTLSADSDVQVLWRDSGSTAESARRSAFALAAKGVDRVIGPMGGANVRAASQVLGSEGIILPSEARGEVRGMAPSLVQRCEALVDVARIAGLSLLVFRPESGYGKRAERIIREYSSRVGVNVLKYHQYSTSESTFASMLRPWASELRSGIAVLVPDAIHRVELIVRQIRAQGVDLKKGKTMVLTPGESLGPRALGRGHEALEGVYVAPVAAVDGESSRFAETYKEREGTEPDDQALLVWKALSYAWEKTGLPPIPTSRVMRIRGGHLVSVTTK